MFAISFQVPLIYAAIMFVMTIILIYMGRRTYDIDKQLMYLGAIITFIGLVVATVIWFLQG